MNIKIKAGLIVAGMLGVGILATLAVKLAITYISVDILPHLLMGTALSIAIYTLYDITLANLRYREKLKDMVDRK